METEIEAEESGPERAGQAELQAALDKAAAASVLAWKAGDWRDLTNDAITAFVTGSHWVTDPVRARRVIARMQAAGPAINTPPVPAAQMREQDLPDAAAACFIYQAWQLVALQARKTRHMYLSRDAVALRHWRYRVGMVVKDCSPGECMDGYRRGVVIGVTSGGEGNEARWSRVTVALEPRKGIAYECAGPTPIVAYLTDGEQPWSNTGKLWLGADGEGPRPLSVLLPVLDDPATGGLLCQMLPGGLTVYRDPDMAPADSEWGVRCGLTLRDKAGRGLERPVAWEAPSLGRAAVLEAWRLGMWAPPGREG